MTEFIVYKSIAGAGIFVMTILGCFLPFVAGNIINSNLTVLCICTGFSGGVLLGAGLIHMLPEASEYFSDFPWAETLCGFGYAFTYFIESYAFHGGVEHAQDHIVAASASAVHKTPAHLCIGEMDTAIVFSEKSTDAKETSPSENEEQPKQGSSYGTFADGADTQDSISHGESHPPTGELPKEPEFRRVGSDCCHPGDHEHASFSHRPSTSKDKESPGGPQGCKTHAHDHEIHVHNIEFHDNSPITAFVLVLALSFHAVMAGMSLGLAEDWAEYSACLIAIVSHKFVTSFALGLRFLQQVKAGDPIPWQVVIVQLAFSLMTPAGIVAGILVVRFTEAAIIPALCKSISAGCFLYVAITTITETTDRMPKKFKSVKFAFLFIGYAFMVYVKTLE